jgi:hypothetical protein
LIQAAHFEYSLKKLMSSAYENRVIGTGKDGWVFALIFSVNMVKNCFQQASVLGLLIACRYSSKFARALNTSDAISLQAISLQTRAIHNKNTDVSGNSMSIPRARPLAMSLRTSNREKGSWLSSGCYAGSRNSLSEAQQYHFFFSDWSELCSLSRSWAIISKNRRCSLRGRMLWTMSRVMGNSGSNGVRIT